MTARKRPSPAVLFAESPTPGSQQRYFSIDLEFYFFLKFLSLPRATWLALDNFFGSKFFSSHTCSNLELFFNFLLYFLIYLVFLKFSKKITFDLQVHRKMQSNELQIDTLDFECMSRPYLGTGANIFFTEHVHELVWDLL
jgi:hypothetical protein